jgi:eukaryotic-like serine/threonine-protein kinase
VLYEMITGKRAFEGKSQASLIGAIMHATPPPIAAGQPLAPAALDRIVKVCLAKDPDDRWQSVGDLKRELQWLAEGGSQGTALAPVVAQGHAREYLAWGLAALATLLAIGASFLYLRAPSRAGAMVRFTVAAPSGATRAVDQGFAISPDGQTIAFRANGTGGVSRIFTRRLDQADALPVIGTDNGTAPFWSPDSRSLGFFREDALYRIDLDGSAPRRLCGMPDSAAFNPFVPSAGTWGAKGVIVFASRSIGLSRVPDTGGTPISVTSLDAANKEVSHLSPWFLPDGRHLIFLALSGQTKGVIWAVAIDDPARTRVAESSGGAAYVDGWLLMTTAVPRSLFAQRFDLERLTLQGVPRPVRDRLVGGTTNGGPGFSVSATGALAVDRPPPIIHQLAWMDRAGRVLATVGPAAVVRDFSLAPDERRVAADVTDIDSQNSNLWLFDPLREEGTRLTFQASITRAMWALDGRHIYFTISPSFELRSLTGGATVTEPFENPGGFMHFEDVTRDGRYLVFKSVKNRPAIWIQRVGVPGERRALVQDQFPATQGRVSPNGRWLAYTLYLPRGTEIFVQPFDRPGDRVQVSRTGGAGAIWRADGRELYYEGSDGLMAVTMTERDGALDAGPPQKLFGLHTQGYYVANQPHNVEVAANGQKFLVNTIVGDSDNVPIEVTLNWQAELK